MQDNQSISFKIFIMFKCIFEALQMYLIIFKSVMLNCNLVLKIVTSALLKLIST